MPETFILNGQTSLRAFRSVSFHRIISRNSTMEEDWGCLNQVATLQFGVTGYCMILGFLLMSLQLFMSGNKAVQSSLDT